MDLEMTGLNPETDRILQVAVVLTDENLNILEEYVSDVFQPPDVLEAMSPFVRKMHQKTGLFGRIPEGTELGQVEREVLDRVSGWCPARAVLCGNTIHSDRKFIDRYMPGLATYLHYRMVDVSSLKVLSQLWLPSTAQYRKPDSGEHDALFDVRQSIAELVHYRSVMFRDVSPA